MNIWIFKLKKKNDFIIDNNVCICFLIIFASLIFLYIFILYVNYLLTNFFGSNILLLEGRGYN
jgi:hypothetical protein